MKKILLTLTGFILTFLSFAQSPNLMNYQGVARNAVGNVLPNQPVALRLSILSGSPTGPVEGSRSCAHRKPVQPRGLPFRNAARPERVTLRPVRVMLAAW